ncbi:MAG: hypothetical protein OXC57_04020 [Rhodobacteraceae bacterium]|nr:hypothetical protein [Paracoccaceae bacterium]
MSNNYLVTRRQNIVGLAASLTLPALPAMSISSKIDQLSLYGPPAGPSVTLAHVWQAEDFWISLKTQILLLGAILMNYGQGLFKVNFRELYP